MHPPIDRDPVLVPGGNPELPRDLRDAIESFGLLASGQPVTGEALSGGVSSDIWRVDLRSGPVCVKRALAQLRVAAEWRVPVERNANEADWIEIANQAVPGVAPELLARDAAHQAFAMRWLDPRTHPTWKDRLRQGDADPAFAHAVGARLARIHAATAGRAAIRDRFATDSIFHDIRIEPYLLATAAVHPEHAPTLRELARRTAETRLALVHGDVSPKNILCGPRGPVFIDAECAWYGDPAFDLAFCLNHLLLKCRWTPSARNGFLRCFAALTEGYLDGVDWEPRESLDSRAATLLPGLLLARVDGKSPVEYLTRESDRRHVRDTALRLLERAPRELRRVAAAWQEADA